MQLQRGFALILCTFPLLGICFVRSILNDEIASASKRLLPVSSGKSSCVLRSEKFAVASRICLSGSTTLDTGKSWAMRLRGGAAKAADTASGSAAPAKAAKAVKGAKSASSKEDSQEAPKAKGKKAASKTAATDSGSDPAPTVKAKGKAAAKAKSNEKSQDAYSVQPSASVQCAWSLLFWVMDWFWFNTSNSHYWTGRILLHRRGQCRPTCYLAKKSEPASSKRTLTSWLASPNMHDVFA
jgi:hypothetical protein